MENITAFGRLIADRTRLKIIKLLLAKPMCVCELMDVLRLNQPCVSQHLTVLKYRHLLNAERKGKWIVYAINRQSLDNYLKGLESFLRDPLGKISYLKPEAAKLSKLKDRGFLCQKLKRKQSSLTYERAD